MTQATNTVYTDLSIAQLIELAVQRKEGQLADNGASLLPCGIVLQPTSATVKVLCHMCTSALTLSITCR